VKASIVEVSPALTPTLAAPIPLPSFEPSMYASTSVAMRLSAPAPAPLSEAPTNPPEIATAPAKTVAWIDWLDRASSVSAPSASTLESRR
jgi:hypothetical protein